MPFFAMLIVVRCVGYTEIPLAQTLVVCNKIPIGLTSEDALTSILSDCSFSIAKE